jgi:hypothetical protein
MPSRGVAMQQIKLFKGIVNELEMLESDVNEWIAKSGHRIVSLTGNIAPQTHSGETGLGTFPSSDVLVIVVYEDQHG